MTAPTTERQQQQQMLATGLWARLDGWAHHMLPLSALARDLLAQHDDPSTWPLRHAAAACAAWSGRHEELPVLLAPLHDAPAGTAWPGLAQATAAASLSLQGRWAEAEAGFDAAAALLKAAAGRRKGQLPECIGLAWVLCLLAQDTAAHRAKALKLCRFESGQKEGSAELPYAAAMLALEMAEGRVAPDPARFAPLSLGRHPYRIDLWRWLLRAWLSVRLPPVPVPARELQAGERTARLLHELTLHAAAGQVEAALQVLQGHAPPAAFFVQPGGGNWRHALAALAAIGQGDAQVNETRLLWVIGLEVHGDVAHIRPFEQRRGARGWGRPREVALSRLARASHLAPPDVAVVRALRQPAQADAHPLETALAALVGHPHVRFEDALEVPVALAEGQPALDVVDGGDDLVLRLSPPAAALRRGACVLREAPGRARVFRLTPAQRRAVQLIGEALVVPRSALAQLRPVLRGLGAHFDVHADGLERLAEVREVAPETRLRAELAPHGPGVSLRLVAAPLGPDGPRITPGQGREHVIATLGARTLGTRRDLAAEQACLDRIIDACPVLALASRVARVSADWVIEAPDEALALLEHLPRLPELAAIDWPRGQAIRVDTAGPAQLYVQLRSHRDWLAVQGRLQVDERMVVSLEQLLRWQAEGGRRFVPLGEGRYLALTEALRTRLEELTAVVEEDEARGLRAPALAAAWLQAALEGAQVELDADVASRLARLDEAQHLVPLPPRGLQARLRPYQEEGYAWALRLAHAGFGGVLADDMGLGKTLQSLAVLLARAQDGPALVVAPTSLIGNWAAEAARFAPGLRVAVYGEADGPRREALVARAGPGDVLLVSYPLMQGAPALAQRRWHTLIVDEAQAIRNPAALRTQAVSALQADFRLALTGTPVENRLLELWALMHHVCNPGLLGSMRRFQDRFADPIELDGNRQAQRVLRRLIAPFVLRRTKAQVLDELPPRTEQLLMVMPDEAERAHYEAVRRQALAAAKQAVGSDKPAEARLNILAQLTRLRRAACDPRLVTPSLPGGAKLASFMALARHLVANGHRTLVFSQFTDFLALLREALEAGGFGVQYLDGGTPAAERTRRVAAFQAGEGDFFLISLKAGGVGLNLTAADYVVIADPWWNPAAEDQASSRAHRLGQQRSVTVYRLVTQGTVEERVLELHRHKRELAEAVLDGLEVPVQLDPQALVDLMRAPGVGMPKRVEPPAGGLVGFALERGTTAGGFSPGAGSSRSSA